MAYNYHFVAVKKIVDDAIVPKKGSSLSACFDIYSRFHTEILKGMNGINAVNIEVKNFGKDDAYILLYPNDNVLIPTGLIFCLPFHSCMHIYSRSGNAFKGNIIVLNAPGIIDPDYTLETYVLLRNVGNQVTRIYDKKAIAQGTVVPIQQTCFSEIDNDEFAEFKNSVKYMSDRDGGFGSTDKK